MYQETGVLNSCSRNNNETQKKESINIKDTANIWYECVSYVCENSFSVPKD